MSLNLQQAISAAQHLENDAYELDRLRTIIGTTGTNIRNVWIASEVEKVNNSIESMRNMLNQKSDSLDCLSSDIKNAAVSISNSEAAAAAAAKKKH